MEIKGLVENLVFRNSENGYTVLDLDCNGELITCVGYFPIISEGEQVVLQGEFKINNKYGKQFTVASAKVSAPQSLEGIEKYLSSGLIRGIGPITAHNIVEKFGKETLQIIEFNSSRLSEVRGVSKSKAEEIFKAFAEIKKMQESIMFLQKYELSLNLSLKIYETYGTKTEQKVRTNPYRLVEDIDGVGFITADRLAQKMGVEKNSGFRIRAGVTHVLKECAEKGGNTVYPRYLMEEDLYKLLQVDASEKLLKVLDEMTLEGVIKNVEIDDMPALALSRYYNVEQSIATRLSLMCVSENEKLFDIEKQIEFFESRKKIKFHDDQKKAIALACESGVCVLTGGPGTGKTTIINCICSLFADSRKSILLLAPTGRAAKRLSESTSLEAKTIHRGLEVDPTSSGFKFKFNEQEKLKQDVIIVDEVSMIDCILMNNLLKAIKHGAKLILVGDKNQLPSVGAGNVLADILASDVIPTVNLTQIYRQEEDSFIITNAHAINNGEMPELSNSSKDFFFDKKQEPEEICESVISMVTSRIPIYSKLSSKNIQVLAPMKSGKSGVDVLNKKLQETLNPPSLKKQEIVLDWTIFRQGDRVMQTQNDYSLEWIKHLKFGDELGTGVFNGDIGEIVDVSRTTGELTVLFEDGRRALYNRGNMHELMLAYAITVHKSQGCEFDVVVMPVVAGPNIIFTRNLLYTAITRAKKMVVLVGTKMNISRMVRNNFTAKRFSLLKTFLQEKFEEVKRLYS